MAAQVPSELPAVMRAHPGRPVQQGVGDPDRVDLGHAAGHHPSLVVSGGCQLSTERCTQSGTAAPVIKAKNNPPTTPS